MIATTRPLAAATTALMGAAVIAATPVITAAPPALPTLSAPQIALQASIVDILGFPVYQQAIANEVEFVAIRAAGLAQGGAGLVESLLELPSALINATQQTLGGDPLDALTTLEEWALGSVSATVVPPYLANIDVGQIQLAIQSALLLAQPVAAVQLGSGIFTSFDTIARSFIIAGQSFVDAVLSFNIGNIVQAVVDGVSGVVGGFLTGGQAIIDGIAGAQTTLVTALQARPVQILPLTAAAAAPGADAPAASAPARTEADAAAETTPAIRAVEVVEPSAGAARVGAARADTASHRSASVTRAVADRNTEPPADDDAPAKADGKRAATR